MEKFIGQLFIWLFGKNKTEREGICYYLKSLILLMLIVILFDNLFWDINGNIIYLIGQQKIDIISRILCMLVHFYVSFSIIMLIVYIIIIPLKLIIKKSEDLFFDIKLGIEYRLSCCTENIIIFIFMLFILKKLELIRTITVYPKCILVLLAIIELYGFFKIQMVGIINRFLRI